MSGLHSLHKLHWAIFAVLNSLLLEIPTDLKSYRKYALVKLVKAFYFLLFAFTDNAIFKLPPRQSSILVKPLFHTCRGVFFPQVWTKLLLHPNTTWYDHGCTHALLTTQIAFKDQYVDLSHWQYMADLIRADKATHAFKYEENPSSHHGQTL